MIDFVLAGGRKPRFGEDTHRSAGTPADLDGAARPVLFEGVDEQPVAVGLDIQYAKQNDKYHRPQAERHPRGSDGSRPYDTDERPAVVFPSRNSEADGYVTLLRGVIVESHCFDFIRSDDRARSRVSGPPTGSDNPYHVLCGIRFPGGCAPRYGARHRLRARAGRPETTKQ